MRTVQFLDEQGFRREVRWKGERIEAGQRTYNPENVSFLPPCSPTKIICIGRNYADHAAEMDSEVPERPLLFVKTPNTVTGHDRTVRLPDPDKEYEHEAELGVVIDRQARNVESSEAMEYVRGYTAINDLSNRTDQRREQNWVRGKAFDGAAPIGPVLVPPGEVSEDAEITCHVNGELRQQSSRNEMIFSIPELIEEITAYLTLEAGDVIATGTPPGVSPVRPGDRVEVSIEGIGTLGTTIADTA
jgi:2-keto-4-pentenoate hydratase/2-oxohepta-3-ene-1,7-dioic acid hydratase in catechol pathway